MKSLPWAKSALALCIMGALTACGGGGADGNNQGDIVDIEPPVVVDPPVEEPSGIVNTPLPFHENFGDGAITAFDEADTQYFLSPQYKTLQTAQENAEYEDSYPSMWYPTCCFFVDEKVPDPANTEINLDELGIASDNGNPSLVLSNARLTVGQTLSELANPEAKTAGNTDHKKDSSAGDAKIESGSWGEFDLSEPYRVSFCVKAVRGGAGSMLIYVDSNHSNTNTGTSIHSNPLILNAGTPNLVPGQRVEINVPGETTFKPGGNVESQITDQIGSATSFLQLRVPSDGGAQVIIDDLLIERQSDDGQTSLPACNTFVDASEPDAPEQGPDLTVRDMALGVNWDSVTGATSYDLAWNTSGETPTAANVTGLTGSSYMIKDLENGTNYHVFLRGVNSAGPSGWSPATTAMPEAPLGCSPTTEVPTNINWSVWDGCVAPHASGAVVTNGSTPANFAVSEDSHAYFIANNDGTTTLKTTDENGADLGVSANADLSGVMTDSSAGYPRYFTWIGRMDAPTSATRGFEVEISFGEEDKRRVKTILRPDSGKVQLEKFVDNSATAEAEMELSDGFHIYHAVFTINGPADITARIYRDGINVSDLFTDSDDGVVDVEITGTGRDGGSSSPRLRIGEGSGSNPYVGTVDWLIWSDDPAVAALEPEGLKGELPGTIGELGDYAGDGQGPVVDPNVILSENFDTATDGDGDTSSLFTADYKGIETETAFVPFYNANNAASRTVVVDGALTFYNSRFTLGDPAGADKTTTAGDITTRGVLDLSKPYTISFDVTNNDHAMDDDGKCQVYIDNDGTSSGESFHGGDSKVYEALVGVMADGGFPVGTVTIDVSEDENGKLVGTETSFIQFRCDSRVDTPITIDNLVIKYQ